MTSRQLDLLRFISRYLLDHRGVAPTFEEMRVGICVQSKNCVSRLLSSLREQGLVAPAERSAHRRIELTLKGTKTVCGQNSAPSDRLLSDASEDELVAELQGRGWQFLGRRS
jgi:SOS-response transcriptional repressor LexA